MLSRPQRAAETACPVSEPAKMPANCGLFLRDRETAFRIGLRGGPGRTRTSNQTVMSWKDSNLQPGRYERTSSAPQRANFSGLRDERTQCTCQACSSVERV